MSTRGSCGPNPGQEKERNFRRWRVPCRLADPFAEAVGLQGVPTHSEAQEAAHSPLTGAGVAGRMGRALHFNLGWQFWKRRRGMPVSRSCPAPSFNHELGSGPLGQAVGPGTLATSLSPPPSSLPLSLCAPEPLRGSHLKRCAPQPLFSLPSRSGHCVLLVISLLHPADFLP